MKSLIATPFETRVWRTNPKHALLNPTMDLICLVFDAEIWVGRFSHWEKVWTRSLQPNLETVDSLKWTDDGLILCVVFDPRPPTRSFLIEFLSVQDGSGVPFLPSLSIENCTSSVQGFNLILPPSTPSINNATLCHFTSFQINTLNSEPLITNSIFPSIPCVSESIKDSSPQQSANVHVTIAITNNDTVILSVFGSVLFYVINLSKLLPLLKNIRIIRTLINTRYHIIHFLVESESFIVNASSSLGSGHNDSSNLENVSSLLSFVTVLVPELQNLNSRLTLFQNVQRINQLLKKLKKKIKQVHKACQLLDEKFHRHLEEYQKILKEETGSKFTPSVDCIQVLLTGHTTVTFNEFLSQFMTIKYLKYWKALVDDWFNEIHPVLHASLPSILDQFRENCIPLFPFLNTPQSKYSSNLTLLLTAFLVHFKLATETYTKFHRSFHQFNSWLQSFVSDEASMYDHKLVYEFCKLYWKKDHLPFLKFFEISQNVEKLSLPIHQSSGAISFFILFEKIDTFWKDIRDSIINPSETSTSQVLHCWSMCAVKAEEKTQTYLTEINQGDLFASIFSNSLVFSFFCTISVSNSPSMVPSTVPFQFKVYLSQYRCSEANRLLGWIFPLSILSPLQHSSIIKSSSSSFKHSLCCLVTDLCHIWFISIPLWPNDPWILFDTSSIVQKDSSIRFFPLSKTNIPFFQSEKVLLLNPTHKVQKAQECIQFCASRNVVCILDENRSIVFDLKLD
ncbi:hypothetical protein HMI54_007666 [Coelomomyces lativittatus]|nr:hypothetical protein HMI55_001064 [Coelomomyces lativittatus]KAJ1510623.1 hypothetical protein HMI56_006250 [Coelomomyces lativittatus]KAJ1516932.1 hypothetical protein HMI54_007666 [Coelomomyces lativittatus]